MCNNNITSYNKFELVIILQIWQLRANPVTILPLGIGTLLILPFPQMPKEGAMLPSQSDKMADI